MTGHRPLDVGHIQYQIVVTSTENYKHEHCALVKTGDLQTAAIYFKLYWAERNVHS